MKILFLLLLSSALANDFLSAFLPGAGGGGGGGDPISALLGSAGGGGGGGDPISALLGSAGGGGGDPFSSLISSFIGGGNGGDPFDIFSQFLGGGGDNPLSMFTDMFSGKGGGDLMSLLTGGGDGGGGNPLDFMNMLGGGDAAPGNLLTMFTPQSADPPVKSKRDCLKKPLDDRRDIFGQFMGNLPQGTGDQLFADIDVCKQKKDENAWNEVSKFLRNPPKDLRRELSRSSRKQCRRGLAIEKSNCRQLEQSMCSMLGGEKGLEPNNIFGQMKSLANRGTKSAVAENRCEHVEKVLVNQDPARLPKLLGNGGTDLILGEFASKFMDGIGRRKRK